MKKVIAFLLIMAFSTFSFSQSNSQATTSAKTDYLKKSKRQRVVAWSLLLGGFGLEAGALAFYESETGAAFAAAGLLSNLTSIPFFISARKNKKKGMRLVFKNEMVPQLQKSSIVYKTCPSVTLNISL